MAPTTLTETSQIRDIVHDNICEKFKFNHVTENGCYQEKVQSQHKISPYYGITLSKTDPKWLTSVRALEKDMGFVTSIRWTSAIPILLFHIITITWVTYTMIIGDFPKWQTGWLAFLLGEMAGFGVTAGAHRYWTHRSFKAKLPLQLILLFCYSIAGQNNLYNWVRDHRLHHKCSESSADPHDARRGFFFSHMGWLMMKKHPHVLKEGSKIDMSDITNDPLLRFYNNLKGVATGTHTINETTNSALESSNALVTDFEQICIDSVTVVMGCSGHFISDELYFNCFKLALCVVIPTVICVVGWDETWIKAIQIQTGLRYMLSLNFTWSVNSFAHLWGFKPYDPNIMPAENLGVSIVAMGEGWHNYHHTFPWDYKAAELAYFFNVTTFVLDIFAKVGWAYDLKQASPDLVQTVVNNRFNSHSH